MMVVVAGVTGATLSISQKKFQESYRDLYARLFQSQNNAFANKQGYVLNGFKQTSAGFVKTRRLQLALEEVADGETEDLYDTAKNELDIRRLIESDAADTNALRVTFYLFLGTNGQVILSPSSSTNLTLFTSQKRLKQQLGQAGQVLNKTDKQVVIYITPENKDGQMELQQAIPTKVIDAASGNVLGALAVGFPTPDLEGGNEMKAGILI